MSRKYFEKYSRVKVIAKRAFALIDFRLFTFNNQIYSIGEKLTPKLMTHQSALHCLLKVYTTCFRKLSWSYEHYWQMLWLIKKYFGNHSFPLSSPTRFLSNSHIPPQILLAPLVLCMHNRIICLSWES